MEQILTEYCKLFEERTKLPCPHGLIISDSGEGKNYIVKTEIETILRNTMDDVIIIDFYNDFGIEDFGPYATDRIRFHRTSSDHINPLVRYTETPTEDESLWITVDKIDLLCDLAQRLGHKASPREYAEFDRIIANLYETKQQTGPGATLSDLLETIPTDNCMYDIISSLCSHECFNNPTNVGINRRLTIFNMGHLGENSDAIAGVYFTLEYIHNMLQQRIRHENSGRRVWLYITNLDHILGEVNSQYIERFWKTSRKLGCICTGLGSKPRLISKEYSYKAYCSNETLHKLLRNSGHVIIPRITKHDKELLKIIDISEDDEVDEFISATDDLSRIMYIIGDKYGVAQLPPRRKL